MRRERERHALVAREEFLEVEGRQLERLGQDDLLVLEAVRSMQQIGRVELEQPASEVSGLCVVLGETHHVDPQQHDRR